MAICTYHRDRLGIYWRGRRKTCQVPPELANHKSSKMKGDRSVLKRHSVLIKQLTGMIVPVGSGKIKHVNCSAIIVNVIVSRFRSLLLLLLRQCGWQLKVAICIMYQDGL